MENAVDTAQVITLILGGIAAAGGLYTVLFGQKALVAWLTERRAALNAAYRPAIVDEDRNRRNKEALLKKVRSRWVDAVLKSSIKPTGFLELDLQYEPGAVERPWEQDSRHSHVARPAPVCDHSTILEVFDNAHGRLLILGEPGSGKTIAMLELARSLIERAEKDLVTPIPVVFNLASWAEARKRIEYWLMDELSLKYEIPREIGGWWIQRGELLLLLDGLDEVKQEYQGECVSAINSFVQAHEEVKLAVCCRNAEYERIPSHLRLHEAVVLQPLTPEKVERCLSSVGHLYPEVRRLFQKDPAWQGFAHSPLLFNSLMVASQSTSFASAPKFASMEDRRRYMLDAYVDCMFDQGGLVQRFDRDRTLNWLRWLARKMKEHTQDLFLIEKIQPDWLPEGRKRLYDFGVRLFLQLAMGVSFGMATGVAAGMVFGSSFGVISSIAFGIAWALISWLAFERRYTVWDTLTIGVVVGIAFGVGGWMAQGTPGAIGFGLIGFGVGLVAYRFGGEQVGKLSSFGTTQNVVLIEALTPSWTKAARSISLWIPFGMAVGMVIGIAVWLQAGPLAGLIYAIATALVYILTFGIAGGLSSGEIETKTVPNQGILHSRQNGTRMGNWFGLIIGLVFGFSFGLTFGPVRGVLGGLTSGLAGWTVGWCLFGGLTYIQHYWLRTLLVLGKCMPWNYAEFLKYASERCLLRTVGGGYMFIHRLLLDYFAQG